MMPCELTGACEQIISQSEWEGLSAGKQGTLPSCFLTSINVQRRDRLPLRDVPLDATKTAEVLHSKCDLIDLIGSIHYRVKVLERKEERMSVFF